MVQATIDEQIERFEKIRKAAIGGDASAIEEVIYAYQHGEGVEPDARKAFEWQKLAAERGQGKAYFDIAIAYLEGVVTTRDPASFQHFMTKAVEALDDTEAMFKLAEAHGNGTLGEISLEKAFSWTLMMADKGAAGAMIAVAHAFKTGRGVTKDHQKYVDWSRRAVDAAKTAKEQGIAAVDAAKTAKRKGLADTSGGDKHKPKFDWVFEDLPRSLLALAETLTAQDPQQKELVEQAANEADIAINLCRKHGEEIPLDVIEMMHLQAKTYETADGTVDSSNAGVYLEWLKKIAAATRDVTVQGLSANGSNDLAGAVYKLAKGYRDGSFVRKNRRKYEEFLRVAANANSAEAHFELARLVKTDNAEYQTHIDEAVRLNHIEAFIVASLNKSGATAEIYTPLLKCLKDLSEAVTRIKKTKHLFSGGDEFVAHYTDRGALTSMLSGDGTSNQNVQRLYNILYFNDPDEGKRLVKAGDSKNPLTKFFDPMEPIPGKDLDFFVHVGSLSLVADRLDLWRAYGRDGTGYCIVTPLSAFSDNSHKPLMSGGWTDHSTESSAVALSLYRVLYEDSEVDEALAEISPILQAILTLDPNQKLPFVVRTVRTIVSELLYLYKSKEYSSENEVRMLSALNISDPALKRDELRIPSRLYIETPPLLFEPTGSKIIIGPKVDNKAEAMVDLQHRLAIRRWGGNCTVAQSKTRYK